MIANRWFIRIRIQRIALDAVSFVTVSEKISLAKATGPLNARNADFFSLICNVFWNMKKKAKMEEVQFAWTVFSVKTAIKWLVDKMIKMDNFVFKIKFNLKNSCKWWKILTKKVYKRGRKHQCQFANEMPFRCEKCGVFRQKDDQHYCYVQPYWLLNKIKGNEEDDEQKQIRFCFFDVETTQDKKVAINGVKVLK